MHIAFLNPQGNFDAGDRYWTEHPDFGGQLVYVKNVAVAMAALGHRVDIVTRRVEDPLWPEFADRFDGYADAPGVRIVRIDCGDDGRYLRKELLWPFLVRDWVPNILDFYGDEGGLPDAMTGHYGDGGLVAALISERTGIPFTFTAHSLGAQKLDKLLEGSANPTATLRELNAHYHFGRRLVGERIAMNRSAVNVTSTTQERIEQYGHHAYRGAVDVDDANRFAVIPPGVNLAVFDAEVGPLETGVSDHVDAMLARDLDPDRLELPSVVASSRLDDKKNHLSLVEAFARHPELAERANLVILTGNLEQPLTDDGTAGESEKAVLGRIRDVIGSADLAGKVAGFAVRGQRALADAYRHLAGRRSVFALTALYEPFGLAPLEAAAAGLPVVVTRNGGPSESMRYDDHEYGVLVDPVDPQDIAAGILRVIETPASWNHFSEAGRQRVHDRYTWERTAAGYVDAIRANPAIPENSLPIHDYFREPSAATDITLAELEDLIGD